MIGPGGAYSSALPGVGCMATWVTPWQATLTDLPALTQSGILVSVGRARRTNH